MATEPRKKPKPKTKRLSATHERLVLVYWGLGRTLGEFLDRFPELDEAAVKSVWSREDRRLSRAYDHAREERLALERVNAQLADTDLLLNRYVYELELYDGPGIPKNGSTRRFSYLALSIEGLRSTKARLEKLAAELREQLGRFDGAIKGEDNSRPAAVVNIIRGEPERGDEPEGRGGE